MNRLANSLITKYFNIKNRGFENIHLVYLRQLKGVYQMENNHEFKLKSSYSLAFC